VAEISGGQAYPKPIPTGFHAFHGPDFLPRQIRLCVPGFMARSAANAACGCLRSGLADSMEAPPKVSARLPMRLYYKLARTP
jgi:hypothetical protein